MSLPREIEPRIAMDAERWKRIDELLQAALQMPAERQDEFLRQQRVGDFELLEEVRSLLSSHRKAGSFRESPLDADTALKTPALEEQEFVDPVPGRVIAHDRILSWPNVTTAASLFVIRHQKT